MSKPYLRTTAAVLLLLLLFCFASCQSVQEGDLPPSAKPLVWAIGAELPLATDFFEGLAEGASVSFAPDGLSGLQQGENTVKLIYRSPKGKEHPIQAQLSLIEDTEPPQILGVQELVAYVGDGISYRSGVSVTDNCGGKLTLSVASTAVDSANEGVYDVIYTATDLVGNTATASTKLHIYREKITKEMLFAELDLHILELDLANKSREEQAKSIFAFVHTNAGISYINTSDKTDWVRAAYFCLRDGQGDCFSFFSLSKGFFERLGIENMDIQRLPGYTTDTHYWSLINIAAPGEAAQWYHYDATRVRDVSYSAALLTDRQVQAFSLLRSNFYLYDTTAYPPSATVEKIARPDLEPYYS